MPSSKPDHLQGVETSLQAGGWYYVLDFDGVKYIPIGPYRTQQLAMSAGREELRRMQAAQRS